MHAVFRRRRRRRRERKVLEAAQKSLSSVPTILLSE
jgi:hypothetical protein